MKRNILLILSLLSSMLFLYETKILNVILSFICIIVLYFYLKDETLNKLDNRRILDIVLICLMMVSKGLYTYGTLIRALAKLYRLPAAILFCIPNLYWIVLFANRLNGTIKNILNGNIDKKLPKIVTVYILYMIICKFIVEMFPTLEAIDDFNYSLLFYVSIPLMIYGISRLLTIKKDYAFKSLMIMILLVIVTSHINAIIQGSYIITWQSYYTFNLVFNALLIYPLGEFIVKSNNQKTMYKYMEYILYARTVFIFIALIIAIFDIKSNIFPNIYMVQAENMRLCINNMWAEGVGNLAATFCMLSLILIYVQKNKIKKLLNLVCLVINFICLCLSNTRTPLYGFILCGIVYIYIISIKSKNYLKSLLAILIFIAISYFGITQVFKVFDLSQNEESVVAVSNDSTDYAVRSIFDKGLNGRNEIWDAGINYLLENPSAMAFGVSQVSVQNILADSGRSEFAMHNEYLEIADSYGVFTLISYLTFSLIIIIKCIKLFFGKDSPTESKIFIPMIMLEMMVYLLCNGITSSINYDTILYFISCGIIVNLSSNINKSANIN